MENIIPQGEIPAILFTSEPIPPSGELPKDVLAISDPGMYILIRDIVRDDWIGRAKEPDGAKELQDALQGKNYTVVLCDKCHKPYAVPADTDFTKDVICPHCYKKPEDENEQRPQI